MVCIGYESWVQHMVSLLVLSRVDSGDVTLKFSSVERRVEIRCLVQAAQREVHEEVRSATWG